MRWAAHVMRALSKLRFSVLGLATIKDIPTARFHALVAELVASGWSPMGRYSGFDAGIDHACVTLRKRRVTLRCEWDNWTEGSLEGPRRVIEELARDAGLPVTHAWRWSDHD